MASAARWRWAVAFLRVSVPSKKRTCRLQSSAESGYAANPRGWNARKYTCQSQPARLSPAARPLLSLTVDRNFITRSLAGLPQFQQVPSRQCARPGGITNTTCRTVQKHAGSTGLDRSWQPRKVTDEPRRKRRPDPRLFPLLLTQAAAVASAALHSLCMDMKEGAGAVISTWRATDAR